MIGGVASTGTLVSDQMDNIKDIREYDVPYHVRVAIDNKINAVSIKYILFIVDVVNVAGPLVQCKGAWFGAT